MVRVGTRALSGQANGPLSHDISGVPKWPRAAASEIVPVRLKADEFSASRQPSGAFVRPLITCSTIVLQYL
jgi:hypothetical protein